MSTSARFLWQSTLLHRSRCSLVTSGTRACVKRPLSRTFSQLSLPPLRGAIKEGGSNAQSANAERTPLRLSSRIRHDSSRVPTPSVRRLWTRPHHKIQVAEEVESDASSLEKEEINRFSFYSTSSGKFTYAKSLDELSSQEPALDLMLDTEHGPGKPALEEPSYWLDVLKATPEEITRLCARLGVHSLTTEDILGGETNEKLEIHPKYRFISYRSFNADERSASYLASVNVYILSFPHASLSLRSDNIPNSTRIAKRLEGRFGHIKSRSTDWILFEIIDAITDGFTSALKPTRAKIEELSESLVSGDRDSAISLRTIASTRRNVLLLRRLLGNKCEILRALVKRFGVETKSEISLHFSDVEDHLNAITQDLNHWEEALSQSENNSLIQLNLQTSRAQNESSEAISKLTILSTVLLPLNVITGLWGMNVTVPGQADDSLFWFSSLASVMVVVATSGYLFAARFMRRHRRPPSDFK